MRTTLDLDEDVLATAKSLSGQRHVSMGKIISALIRQALRPASAPRMRNGVPLFPLKKVASPPNLELVSRLRDDA